MINSTFNIHLSIEGTNYDNLGIVINQLNLSIEEQLKLIVQTFDLPETNNYIIARKLRSVLGHELIEIIDESKYGKTFTEVGIRSGDALFLLFKSEGNIDKKPYETEESAYNRIRRQRLLLYM